jgi:eukaryotic-like serine/threonine-protein kinase
VSRDEPAVTVDSLMREVARAPEVSIAERAPGSRLGPYELVAPIGAGGMGEGYRARDARLGRDVAIKLLPREYVDSDDRRRRFEHEARATAAVDHPNVLVVHDVGVDAGTPYIVFELLEGETLRRRLARGPTPVADAVRLAAQLAHGLAAAHARGVTHRDLKPDNVFVMPGGRVKILDFGLAKAARVEGAWATVPGMVMGTPGYMSPEQLRGEALDHRTDLFAFGAILRDLLAGSTVPPALERIVRRCLAEDPGERYQSAHDLAFQLDGLGAPAVEAGPAKRSKLATLAVVAALAAPVFAGVGYLAGRRAQHAPAPAPAPAELAPAPPLVEDPQWIQGDDYFVAERPWDHGWIAVHLAKLRKPATTGSREAQFFLLDDSRDMWTSTYWRTRIAAAGDLVIGAFAICFNDNQRDDVYRAPATKDAARTGSWFLGKVTDTSDAAKGWVRIDTYNCAADGLRVAAP